MNSTLGFPLLISMHLAVMLANLIFNKFKMSPVLVITNYCSTMQGRLNARHLHKLEIVVC